MPVLKRKRLAISVFERKRHEHKKERRPQIDYTREFVRKIAEEFAKKGKMSLPELAACSQTLEEARTARRERCAEGKSREELLKKIEAGEKAKK